MLNVATTTRLFTSEIAHFTRSVAVGRNSHFEVQLLRGLQRGEDFPLTLCLADRSGLLVTTPTVARLFGKAVTDRLHAQGMRLPTLILNCTEQTKTLAQVEYICEQAYHHRLDRKSVLIALGGGVCCDLVTMAASWIRRGIATIRLPTSLIGQVDAAIGIKGAVNFKGKKSALGCFYPPETVLIDPSFLHTLADHQLRHGFAEILKMALIRDAELFSLIERIGPELIATDFGHETPDKERLLWLAITDMLEELETNFYEDLSYQRIVDFGHVFSPLIEACSGYAISHGEAVAIDMAYSCVIAHRLGLLSGDELKRILALFDDLGLPHSNPLLQEDLVTCALSESAAHRGGKVNLVLPTRIGSTLFVAERESLDQSIIRAALADLNALRRSTLSLVPPANPIAARSSATLVEQGCLVFDIGGTHLRCGYYSPAAQKLTAITCRETQSHWSLPGILQPQIYEILLDTMHDMASELLRCAMPRHVCVAFPGPIDPRGRVITAPTVWAHTPDQPIDMAADLRLFWPNARIHLLNDVTAAGYRYCEGRGQDNFCILTVSSGIGNKIFLDGKPYLGPANRGGEIGHTQVDRSDDAPLCDCGARGHLGGISSGRGTLSYVHRKALVRPEAYRSSALFKLVPDPEEITNGHIVSAFHRRDPFVLECVCETAQPFAAALAGIHTATGLEHFILIGGFAAAMGEPYRRELAKLASHCCWSVGQEWEQMVQLGCQDDLSGLIGAGRYACEFAT